MFAIYTLGCVPVIIGAVLWVTTKKIVWWEWVISIPLSFAACAIIQYTAITGMTADEETWSGEIWKVVRTPRWVEQYQEAIYRTESYTTTTGFGKKRRTVTRTRRVFSHHETRHRTHPEHFSAHVTFGKKSKNYSTSKAFFLEVRSKWGGESCMSVARGNRPGFHSGDRNDYVLSRQTEYIYPAVMEVRFENRVKAAPSVFSYKKVPENAKVYDYPDNSNWRQSNRLLGLAAGGISILEWDRMNARLGPTKKVNVILIGFGTENSDTAHLQEAKWIGGKKNDLVLCFGGDPVKPTWSYVFGWTEQDIVKRNLETILLDGPVNESIINKIECEVVENYTLKDWSKFNYISIEPPAWSYLLLVGILVVTQGTYFFLMYRNSIDKDPEQCRRERQTRYGGKSRWFPPRFGRRYR